MSLQWAIDMSYLQLLTGNDVKQVQIFITVLLRKYLVNIPEACYRIHGSFLSIFSVICILHLFAGKTTYLKKVCERK
jgi:hypothetical protein